MKSDLDIETLSLAPDDILVETEAFSLCVTPTGEPATEKNISLGHPKGVVGKVIKTGEAALTLLGQQVLLGSLQPCGECTPCRKGVMSFCRGRQEKLEHKSLSLGRARFAFPLTEHFNEMGPELASLGGLVGDLYGMFCAGGFKMGSLCTVVGQNRSFKEACAHVASAIGVRSIDWNQGQPLSPTEEQDIQDHANVRDNPQLVLTSRSSLKDLRLLAEKIPPGSQLVMLDDASHHPIDFDPWLRKGNHVVSFHRCHPELIPELASLVAKGYLNLKEFVHSIEWNDILRCSEGGPLDSEQPLAVYQIIK